MAVSLLAASALALGASYPGGNRLGQDETAAALQAEPPVAQQQPTAASPKPDTSPPASRVGAQIEPFQLTDLYGQDWASETIAGHEATVVLFLGTECPLVQLYAPRLNELFEQFSSQSTAWIAINSNQQDSLAKLQHFQRQHELAFPLLRDVGNAVADAFGATRTPEVFVLDAQQVVRYHGRIDDQYSYGLQRPQVDHHYLRDALQQLLAAEPVRIDSTPIIGCLIGRRQTATGDETVTYANQISRILQRHCVECHRPGEIGPFALTDYRQASGWAEMIAEVVREHRMPPWHASPEHGLFKNDRRMSEEEKQLIYQWVAAGAPQGDEADLPTDMQYASGWQIGEPDLIVAMSETPFDVPATGAVPYKYFVVDPGFTEDKWIKAAECRPGNRAIVHHIIVGVRGEGDFGRRERGVHADVQSDWIAATAPGSPPMTLPPGHAKLVKAGSQLVFQMHYTPNGRPQQDLSHIGLKFADPAEVTHQVLTLKAANVRFRIPPGEANHPVEAAFVFPRDATLLSMFPHMHLRGKSFTYTAVYPDGQREVLLDVPHYDFNWQHAYELAVPKHMSAGTRIECLAHFDNSADNLANPDPTAEVRWGDQTWEEMMIGYFNAAIEVDTQAVEAAPLATDDQ